MIKVSNFINVKDKLNEVGYTYPQFVALLPKNFSIAKSKEEFIYEGTTPTIRKLFKNNGINDEKIENKYEKSKYNIERSFDLILPTIFITAALVSQNPSLISIALGVISNYLTDWFKGATGQKIVKLDIVIEKKNDSFKNIHYEGDPNGLEKIRKIIEKVINE